MLIISQERSPRSHGAVGIPVTPCKAHLIISEEERGRHLCLRRPLCQPRPEPQAPGALWAGGAEPVVSVCGELAVAQGEDALPESCVVVPPGCVKLLRVKKASVDQRVQGV